MADIVELGNVTKDYGSGDLVVHALRGIDLTIGSGEFVAMAGPSGSGKSTLLNIIGALDNATSGTVHVAGYDLRELRAGELSRLRRERIGFVFQNFNLVPVLTALENAEYVLLLQGMSKRERHERVYGVLREVGLEGLENRFPRELSGGQQQRVAIARSIVAEPALVLADEPTANVDSATGDALIDVMHRLHAEKGVTFLFSTHDRRVMERCDRLLLLTDGKITADGDARSVLASR